MKAVERVRLLDCAWLEPLTTSFPGPQFGSSVREELFDAVDAALAGVPSDEYATDHEELRVAVEKWGTETPR